MYRNASIKRPGAYLIFCLLRGGGELIKLAEKKKQQLCGQCL